MGTQNISSLSHACDNLFLTLERKRGIEANAQNYFVSSSDLSVPITSMGKHLSLFLYPAQNLPPLLHYLTFVLVL